jgi:hypothetical protein
MPDTQSDILEELRRRRSPVPFVPFAIIMHDGSEHMVRRPAQFAVQQGNLLLVSSRGTARIALADIARFEERRSMTEKDEKVREDLISHLDRSPFAPFSIQMVDGSTFEIVRRYQAAIGNTKGTVVSADEQVSRSFHVSEIHSLRDLAVA